MSATEKKSYTVEENGCPSPAGSAIEPVDAGQMGNARKRFNFSLKVNQEESSFATRNENASFLEASNADFDPIPPSKRTWNWGAYVA